MGQIEKDHSKAPQLARKWDERVINHGWIGVPNLLLEHQGRLQITSSELNVLLALMTFWQSNDHPAHPSIKNIAKMLGKTAKTIQNNIRSLSNRDNKPSGLQHILPKDWKGFISVHRRNSAENNGNLTNLYHFKPLIEVLIALDEEQNEVKEDLKRKKPRIRLKSI